MKLSIITINYNNAAGLRRTIESVASQSNRDFEYIIIDGGSTDGSVPMFQRFNASTLQRFFWTSEPDNGIYHAMNKGIRMAKGEYVHFLNSGDWLVDDYVVEKMLDELNELILQGQQPDVFVGNKIMVRPDGKIRHGHNDKRPVTTFTFFRGTIEHTSAYIRRALFDTVGLYDETFRIVSDWKWYFEAVLHHDIRVSFTDLYVTYFDNTGISSTNLQLDKAERRQVLEQMLPPALLADYDSYSFYIDQMERLKRYPVIYKLVYLVERVLFKFDKWNYKYWSWKQKK